MYEWETWTTEWDDPCKTVVLRLKWPTSASFSCRIISLSISSGSGPFRLQSEMYNYFDALSYKIKLLYFCRMCDYLTKCTIREECKITLCADLQNLLWQSQQTGVWNVCLYAKSACCTILSNIRQTWQKPHWESGKKGGQWVSRVFSLKEDTTADDRKVGVYNK